MARLREIAPIGTRTARGFACRTGAPPITEWEEPIYPKSPDGVALNAMRLKYNIGLREAAKLLNLKPSELSALEAGSAVFSDPTEWSFGLRALRERPNG